MGIKQTDISLFLEPQSQGFIHDTARSFLKRHKNNESLLAQLKDLYIQGQYSSCSDLIDLIISEGHSISESSDIYLLRAQIDFHQTDNFLAANDWLKQAKLCAKPSVEIQDWDNLKEGISAFAEGDYELGERTLSALVGTDAVGWIAQYRLAYHLFWKNINAEKAMFLLEDLTKQKPEFVKAWSCLGFVYNKMGLKEKAQIAFSRCLEKETNPDRIEFYKQQLAS